MRARGRVSALSLRKSLNSSHRPSRRNGCPYPSALSCRLARGLRASVRRRGCFAFIPSPSQLSVSVSLPKILKKIGENLKRPSCWGGLRDEGLTRRGDENRVSVARARGGCALEGCSSVIGWCLSCVRGLHADRAPDNRHPMWFAHTNPLDILSRPTMPRANPRRSLALPPPVSPRGGGGLVARPPLRADRQIGGNTSRLYRVYTGVHQRRKMTYVLRKRVCDKAARSLPPFEAT